MDKITELTELGDALINFSNRMEKKFMASYDRKKDSWKRLDKKFYIDKMRGWLAVLDSTYPGQKSITSQDDYANNCANIANFAMMLAENYLRGRYDINGKIAKPEILDDHVKELIVYSADSKHLKQYKIKSVFLDTDTGIAHINIEDDD